MDSSPITPSETKRKESGLQRAVSAHASKPRGATSTVRLHGVLDESEREASKESQTSIRDGGWGGGDEEGRGWVKVDQDADGMID